MTDRPLPHSLEAERALLGGVLIAPETYPSVAALSASAFFRVAHARIWDAFRACDEAGTPIDLLTVRLALTRAGALETVGGPVYLADLSDGVPRSTNVEHYAALVQRLATRRAKLLTHRTLMEACYLDVEETDETIADAEAALAQLEADASPGDGVLDADGQLGALLADLEREATGPRIDLGLPAIDQALDGVRPGEVLQIWARPGLGKTMVACHALCGLVSRMPVLCCSLEMPAAQIVRRLARMQFGLTHWRLRQGGLDSTAYRTWFAALRLDATPGLSVAQMAQRVRRLQQQHVPVRVVVVDHLGLIGGDRKMTTYDRVSTQARELKDLAKRYDIAVILLVQVNRESGGDGSRELHLGSARDSGVVEEVADYIVALRRLDRSTSLPAFKRDQFKDVLFAKVLKHRHGATGDRETAYRLDGETLRLREDLTVQADEDDLAAIAQRVGRRR